jgi:hypothetical protein
MALARSVKPALDLIGKGSAGRPARATTPPAAPRLDTGRIAEIAGVVGSQSGAVYKITVGRPDLNIVEMGVPITSRMGLNSWASFVGSDARAAIAGDVAMLGPEVTPVLKALRANGLDVVAIHHHMTSTQPTIYFLHFWGVGPAAQLAAGFRAALDALGRAR